MTEKSVYTGYWKLQAIQDIKFMVNYYKKLLIPANPNKEKSVIYPS